MTTLTNNPLMLHAMSADAALLIAERLVIAWPCTRRTIDPSAAVRGLERIACVVAVQPLDRHLATIECWLEAGGVRQRTVLPAATRPCALHADAALAHVDIDAADGARLLALTLDRGRQRIAYAHTTLLREAGLRGGTYDPPTLRAIADERAAQSA